MEEECGGGPPRPGGIGGSKKASGEVDYKTKSGTAWSHNYLNQKPWHPLSYPNQRRKWIAEQMHSQREQRAEEIAREFAQEQEFFRQSALVSKKEKEKMETMKAVSFMYVRPPGYNPESAKAAEIADEQRKLEQTGGASQQQPAAPPDVPEGGRSKNPSLEERKKNRPKDVFGRALPSEEDFEVLKNAPRLETGAPVRIKPFAVEIRNVRCVRCGNHGHQSGDRECPLKDAIMPNDESRLVRDDPLRAMMAHADSNEPQKWELKQKPGMSPPHGGFQADDPNQQIVPEDIFDEYGGFLGGGGIPPELLNNVSAKKIRKHSSRKKKHKRHSIASDRKIVGYCNGRSSSSDVEMELDPRTSRGSHLKKKRRHHEDSENTSSDEDATDVELESRKMHRKHAKKKRYHGDSETSAASLEEHDTCRELGWRKSRGRRAKEKRRHREDDGTSSTSSEEDDRCTNVKRSQSKSKHVKGNRRNHRNSDSLTSPGEDSTGVELESRKMRSKHPKKKKRHGGDPETPAASSEDHDTGRELEWRKSRSKHAKEKRHHRKDSETSATSSEEDSYRELKRRKSKGKHVKGNRRNHRDSDSLTSSDEDSTDVELESRKRQSKRAKKKKRHRRDSETSSSEDHDTDRELEWRKLRSKHAKEKRRFHKDHETSATSSEEDYSHEEVKRRKPEIKHLEGNRRNHRDSDSRETFAARHHHSSRLTSLTLDSSDNRRWQRKLKIKNKHRNGHQSLGSDSEVGAEESRIKARGKEKTYDRDSSKGHPRDQQGQHSARRKHCHR